MTPTTSRSNAVRRLPRSAVCSPTKPARAVGEAAIAAARFGMKPMLRSSVASVSREPSWMVNMAEQRSGSTRRRSIPSQGIESRAAPP